MMNNRKNGILQLMECVFIFNLYIYIYLYLYIYIFIYIYIYICKGHSHSSYLRALTGVSRFNVEVPPRSS